MSSLSAMLKAPGAMVQCDDDPEAVYEFLCEKGWSDGLPVIPPTPERVERMLAYCDRDLDKPVVKIPPRFGAATPMRIAANAVMAGCKPEYFPLVLLALEALAEEQYNLYGTQATTHPCTPMLIFNGPIAKEVGLNSGNNVMGNYFRANAAIGRAVRLALVNIGAAIPGTGDMATAGHAGKVHVLRRGERRRESVGAAARRAWVAERGHHRDRDRGRRSAQRQRSRKHHRRGHSHDDRGHHDEYRFEQRLLRRPAGDGVRSRACADGGLGGMRKADVKQWLWERATMPLSIFEGRHRAPFPPQARGQICECAARHAGAHVGQARRPGLIVTGGAGKHSAGSRRSAIRALRRAL